MKPFSPQDLFLHQKITHLHCVPGLDLAAAAVRSVDRENDQYRSCIWAFSLSGGPARQLTRGPGREHSPRWAPDGGQLAFISNRGGGAPQIYLMPRHGGEARQLGQFDLGVTQLRWAPDAKSLLAAVALPVDPDARGKRGDRAPPRSAEAAEVCWRLPYKADGAGYLLQREIHLFRIDTATGACSQLTDGAFDVQAFEPSADGKHIAYSRTREGRYAHCTDLWVCDTDGDRPRRLTHAHAAVVQPLWSPNGRWIVFGGAQQEGDGQTSLWLLEFATGQVQPLGPDGLEVGDTENMFWSADSLRLLLARVSRGRHEVVSLSIPDGQLDTLVDGNRQFGAFACNGEHLAYSVDAPDQPNELFACRPDGSGERRLSDLNPWWRDRMPIELERRQFEVPNGLGGTETIQGWLLRAQGHEGPMALLNDVHGGPASYALLDYDTNVYWQSLCSHGWAVLLLNTVGSSSFGREFCERLSGRWGELDLSQHLAAIAQLQDEGLCDERVAIAGKSYGGYLTAWAIGHSDLFRAAVVVAPLGNLETHYGASDGGYYGDPLYVDAAPRFDRGRARELSPLQHIEKAETATLFLQGKDDERCPKCQSEELFVSLYRAGNTPAELVLYPGEGHHFLGQGKPSNRADAARRIIDWVARHAGRTLPRKPQGSRGLEAEHYESSAG
jgi:dipeptidyl aminopeptidase/acylaminoacyl peptidase